ncbi:endopeptidase La [bacterium]|nr:endopeptidase La [bacterium]
MEDNATSPATTGGEYPLLPLRDVVVFPNMMVPLFVGRERSVAALDEALAKDKLVLLTAQNSAEVDEPTADDLYRLGTLAVILQILKLPDGSMKVLLEGMTRQHIVEIADNGRFMNARCEPLVEIEPKGKEMEALVRHVIDQFENYVRLSRKTPQETLLSVINITEPGKLADNVAANLFIKVADKQKILAAANVRNRLVVLSEILSSEIEILELEQKIRGEVRQQMEKSQKEYYLNEQMKAIQRELGQDSESGEELEQLAAQIRKAKMSKEAAEKAFRELDRLRNMPMMSPEATVVRNYLDWMVSLPWAKQTKDRLDIKRAGQILEADHYGLSKPKERILEFLAVAKLKGHLKGPILCLVGPPGVGKTSLGKSIARALARKFVRMSLGGVRDEAEIRGHRRTYIGSMPGRILQSIRKAKSRNPVFLLDEIDKMTADFRGDPSSALLEVLDPEQNDTFVDHYLEVEFDLSNVLFIATANVTYSIPPALKDRMEIIEIPSYTELEKLNIAKGFLVPKQLKNHGLARRRLEFTDDALYHVIREYTREAGVRNLEREIGAVCRKVAKDIALGDDKKNIVVTPEEVHRHLGVPRFRFRQADKENAVGVATGLAWTEVGGEILSVEVSVVPGKGALTLTGKLGEVMQESIKAAISYTRSRAAHLRLDKDFYKNYDIHVHVPEGAIPKDGPSAGITMATAIISALTGRPVRGDVAMTGEITLRGRVLAVGGIKEKLLAAHRAGLSTVILPEENQRDLEDMPKEVLSELSIIPVENMDKVLETALLPAEGKTRTRRRTPKRPSPARRVAPAQRGGRGSLRLPASLQH